MYGLPKVHKPGNPVRPICSAVGTASYNLGRFAAKIIQPAAKNSFGTDLENTFQFVNQVRHCELKDLYMVSFDVRSLFTNIPLNKTIKICLDRLYSGNSDIRPNIPEKTLEQMLRLCVTDNTFVFDGKVYTQIDGVAMGNSLGPILADIYMAHLEETAFLKDALDFSPVFYRRYVDDTFCLFKERSHVQRFLDFINKVDESIQFDVEHEHNSSLSFLDTVVTRDNNKTYPDISNKVKATDKGLFYNFNSFTPFTFKADIMSSLIYRVYDIASSYWIFHKDRLALKSKFKKNGFPGYLFDRATSKFLYKQYPDPNTNSDVQYTAPKKSVIIVLPYLGLLSIFLRRKISRLVHKYYPSANLRVVFQSGFSIKRLFSYKDKMPKKCLGGVVYYTQCESCGPSSAYIGKTINTLYEHFYGPNGHLHPNSQKSALLEHLGHNINPSCEFNIDNVKILDICNNDLKLRYMESIYLKLDHQSLNTQDWSIPLRII